MSISKEKLLVAIDMLRKNEVKPQVVKTHREARQMTKQDALIFGGKARKWKVGDEYYLL